MSAAIDPGTPSIGSAVTAATIARFAASATRVASEAADRCSERRYSI